jgi:hypothetical protein
MIFRSLTDFSLYSLDFEVFELRFARAHFKFSLTRAATIGRGKEFPEDESSKNWLSQYSR